MDQRHSSRVFCWYAPQPNAPQDVLICEVSFLYPSVFELCQGRMQPDSSYNREEVLYDLSDWVSAHMFADSYLLKDVAMVSGGEAQESIYASTSLLQVWDMPTRRHRVKHSIFTLFISLTLVWKAGILHLHYVCVLYKGPGVICYYLSGILNKGESRPICTMAHNGFIPQEIIIPGCNHEVSLSQIQKQRIYFLLITWGSCNNRI